MLLLITIPALSGCSLRVLDPAGPVAAGERVILLDALAIMLCIIVPVIVATLLFAWWFRPDNPKAKRLPQWSFSGRIEIITWSVPLLAIMFLGGLAWIGSHDLDPAKPLSSAEKPLEVQVVSLDWKWLFIYPEQHVATVNHLVLPKGRPAHLSLTSDSVWNAFFVPQLGSMIYTMQGMTTQLNLEASREGTFYGSSTHLSGDGFAGMHFDTDVLSPAQFGHWVATAQSSEQTLDEASYSALTRQSMDVPPIVYRLADPGLFRKIATGKLPPGPGPKAEPAPGINKHAKQAALSPSSVGSPAASMAIPAQATSAGP